MAKYVLSHCCGLCGYWMVNKYYIFK